MWLAFALVGCNIVSLWICSLNRNISLYFLLEKSFLHSSAFWFDPIQEVVYPKPFSLLSLSLSRSCLRLTNGIKSLLTVDKRAHNSRNKFDFIHIHDCYRWLFSSATIFILKLRFILFIILCMLYVCVCVCLFNPFRANKFQMA